MPRVFLPRVVLLSALALLLSLPFVHTSDVESAADGIESEDDGAPKAICATDFTTSEFPVENELLVLTKENFIPAVSEQLSASKFSTDAVLVLFVIYSPDCPHCSPVLKQLEDSSNEICRAWDEIIATSDAWVGDSTSPPPRPILGKLDGTVLDEEFIRVNFDPVLGYPSLKFGLVTLEEDGASDHEEEVEVDNGAFVDIFDYVGPLDNPGDLASSILHYWYRFVGARRMALEMSLSRESDHEVGGGGDYAECNAPVFVVPSDSALMSFMVEHGDNLLRPAPPHLPSHMGDDEKDYVMSLLQTEEDELDFAEPVTLFVQCRLGIDFEHWGSENNVYKMFDDLAEEMSNRRDIAFFAVHAPPGRGCVSGDSGREVDGSVAVLRLRKESKSVEGEKSIFEWKGFDVDGRVPLYIPPQVDSKKGTDGSKVKHSASNLTLTQFVVCQSTPMLLWFNRDVMATYAFPIYRKVHAVLFVDMHHAGKHSPRGDLTASQSRAAVKMFRKAAIDHRLKRPMDDVVFLVVPSTEVRVMTTFGIDIWTGLDGAFAAAAKGEQSRSESDIILPTVMLTSRVGPKDGTTSLKRYYFDLKNEGYEALSQFIKDYFDDKLTPSIQSQAEPKNRTNESGVQIVTGNSFQSLVLDQKEKHTLVHFYAPTCGHCKRFAVIWNELSRLVRALHWDSIIDVMKMDLTKNEVTHDDLQSIWDFPAVYYFPANEKDKSIRMVVEGDAKLRESNLGGVSSAFDLVDWLVRQGRLDEHELLSLHEMGSTRIEERQTKICADGEEVTEDGVACGS